MRGRSFFVHKLLTFFSQFYISLNFVKRLLTKTSDKNIVCVAKFFVNKVSFTKTPADQATGAYFTHIFY